MALTPEQRVLRSRIAAYAANARHDGREITSRARATYRESFLTGHHCRVCPETILPVGLSPTERARRAELLRRGHYARLAWKSSRARSRKKNAPGGSESPERPQERRRDRHPATV